MKKEIIFAIFLGLSLGLIITYGVYRARTTLQKPVTTAPTATPTATPLASAQSSLSITSPDDEIIIDQNQIAVAGTTNPNSFVVIIYNNQEKITTSDDSGNFSIQLNLETGSNVIQIHALDEDGNSTVEERTIIYSTVSLIDEADSASNSGEDTNE